MELFDAISRRKSCRSYTQQPLSEAKLADIRAAIDGFARLYPDTTLAWHFTTEVKGLFKIEAPHYLIITGQGKAGEQESAGFLFEQLILWLDAHDLGSVWLGKATDAKASPGGKDIIALAFGQSGESVHRDPADCKRKPIAEITNAPEDPCIQAVHLAPSGMNVQPWYLEKTGGRVLLYEQLLKPPVSLLYKKTAVDMGIALCHYALAAQRQGQPFSFAKGASGPEKKGYRLFGQIG